MAALVKYFTGPIAHKRLDFKIWKKDQADVGENASRSMCRAGCGISLCASASVRAKELGPSIKIPEGDIVKLGHNGNFTINAAGGGLRVPGVCTCGSVGTCEVESIAAAGDQLLVCHKRKSGTCTSSCSMTTGAK